MHTDPKATAPHLLTLESREYGERVLGVVFMLVGLLPWLYPPLGICERAPDACTYGTGGFLAIGLLLLVLGTVACYVTVLDRERNHYRIRRRGLLGWRTAEGLLSDVTGTLEMTVKDTKSTRTQLGLLDVHAAFHPLELVGKPGSRRKRKMAQAIRSYLGLDETSSLKALDFTPSLSEQFASLRGVALQAGEEQALRAQLQQDPSDVAGFRQLALRLMRLERRQEAAVILRNAHRHLLDQGARNDANRLAGIITALRL